MPSILAPKLSQLSSNIGIFFFLQIDLILLKFAGFPRILTIHTSLVFFVIAFSNLVTSTFKEFKSISTNFSLSPYC